MADTIRFLLKVFLLSAGLSLLFKLAGRLLTVDAMSSPMLNYLAATIVLLPSVIVGTILWMKRGATLH